MFTKVSKTFVLFILKDEQYGVLQNAGSDVRRQLIEEIIKLFENDCGDEILWAAAAAKIEAEIQAGRAALALDADNDLELTASADDAREGASLLACAAAEHLAQRPQQWEAAIDLASDSFRFKCVEDLIRRIVDERASGVSHEEADYNITPQCNERREEVFRRYLENFELDAEAEANGIWRNLLAAVVDEETLRTWWL